MKMRRPHRLHKYLLDVVSLTPEETKGILFGPSGKSNNWRRLHGYPTRRGKTNKVVNCLFFATMMVGMAQESADRIDKLA